MFVVFLDIRSAAVAKTIIDNKIYERAVDHFVAQIWEVRQNIAEKQAPAAVAAAAPTMDSLNPEHHQDGAAQDFDSDNDVIVEIPVMNNNEVQAMAMTCDNCTLWINQPVAWTNFLTGISSKAKDEDLK
jgi:hypothetical protein